MCPIIFLRVECGMRFFLLSLLTGFLLACTMEPTWPTDRYRPCTQHSDCLNNCHCLDVICVPPERDMPPSTCGCMREADCEDDDPCTEPSCNTTTGECDSEAIENCCRSQDDCVSDEVCYAGNCCSADCTGRVCGSDGCGGSCLPGCGAGDTCDEMSGQCEVVAVGTFVPIDPGVFEMSSLEGEAGSGSDENQYTVVLTRSFAMLSGEVTQGQFDFLMGYNPSTFTECGMDCPVEEVSWYEAAAYSNALSLAEGFAACYTCTGTDAAVVCEPDGEYATPYECPGFRLPTEAEWEYAARAGTTTATYNGDLDEEHLSCEQPNNVLDSIAWFCGNSGFTTHVVGTKTPNDWGMYDMLGNVEEWCHDFFGSYPTELVEDPWGPANGSLRRLRGGSWLADARHARAAFRNGSPPDASYFNCGFRLVRTLP